MTGLLLTCAVLLVLALTGNETLAGVGLFLLVILAMVLGHIDERRATAVAG